MYKLILSTFLFVVASSLHAKPVVIEGNAEAFKDRGIFAFSPSDYISGKRELLASARVDEKGIFRMEFDAVETREIQIEVLHLLGTFFAEPGHSYDITIPSGADVAFRKLDQTEILLTINDLPENDLNNLVRGFNTEYNEFIITHYYDFAVDEFKGNPEFTSRVKDKERIDIYNSTSSSDSLKKVSVSNFDELVTGFISGINKKYSQHFSNEFFRDYVRYSLSEVELVAGLHKKTFYREYLMSQKLLHTNPAYMRAFKVFYHDLFEERSNEEKASFVKIINAQFDGMKLISFFENDSTMLGEEIRSTAVIKGLKDVYYDRTYSKNAIEKTLLNIHQSAASDKVKRLALNTYEELKKCRAGWQLEDFLLVDQDNNKWKLYEQSPIHTYIFFFAEWSPQSIKEMLMLEKLQQNYSKDIRIVAISMDEKYEDFQDYVIRHPKQEFTFLYGYGDIELREKVRVRSVPHAIMLQPDHNLMMDFTPLPSQGIQATFEKIRVQNAQGGQGKNTWNKR